MQEHPGSIGRRGSPAYTTLDNNSLFLGVMGFAPIVLKNHTFNECTAFERKYG